MSVQLARLIGHKIIARSDVKALQQADGAYDRRARPFTMKNLTEHIGGERSWGHYLLDTDNTTKIFAFDIDLDKEYRDTPMGTGLWTSLHYMAVGLGWRCERISRERGLGLTVLLSYGGGKGLHVIGMWPEKIPALASRSFAESILGSFNCFQTVRGDIFWKHQEFYPELTIEVFPKQTELSQGGYGNLMRLPLGVNSKTGKEAYFVEPSPSNILRPDEPIETMKGGSFRDW